MLERKQAGEHPGKFQPDFRYCGKDGIVPEGFGERKLGRRNACIKNLERESGHTPDEFAHARSREELQVRAVEQPAIRVLK